VERAPIEDMCCPVMEKFFTACYSIILQHDFLHPLATVERGPGGEVVHTVKYAE